jgi:hypothetical protein
MKILETLKEILIRIMDVQSRVARIETRLMRLADKLEINVKGVNHESV